MNQRELQVWTYLATSGYERLTVHESLVGGFWIQGHLKQDCVSGFLNIHVTLPCESCIRRDFLLGVLNEALHDYIMVDDIGSFVSDP